MHIAYALEHDDTERVRIVLSDPTTRILPSTLRAALASHKLVETDVLDALLADARLSAWSLDELQGLLLHASKARNALAVRALLRDGRADTSWCVSMALDELLPVAFLYATHPASEMCASVLQELVASRNAAASSGVLAVRAVIQLGLAGLRIVLSDPHRASRPGADDLFSSCVFSIANTQRSRHRVCDMRAMLETLLSDVALRATHLPPRSSAVTSLLSAAAWVIANEPRQSSALLRDIFRHPSMSYSNDNLTKRLALFYILQKYARAECELPKSGMFALKRVLQDFVDAEPALSPACIKEVLEAHKRTSKSKLSCPVTLWLHERAKAAA